MKVSIEFLKELGSHFLFCTLQKPTVQNRVVRFTIYLSTIYLVARKSVLMVIICVRVCKISFPGVRGARAMLSYVLNCVILAVQVS